MRRPILNQLEAPRTGFNPLLGSGPRSQPPTDRAPLPRPVDANKDGGRFACHSKRQSSSARASSAAAIRCAERSDEEGRFQDRCFSAPRSHGKRASSTMMLSAVVAGDAAQGGTAGGGVAPSARRARWLRPYALPPRAPTRRSCWGDLLKKIWGYWVMVPPDTTFISSGGGDTASPKVRIWRRFLRSKGDARQRRAGSQE